MFNSAVSYSAEVCGLFSVEGNSGEEDIVGCPSDNESIGIGFPMYQC